MTLPKNDGISAQRFHDVFVVISASLWTHELMTASELISLFGTGLIVGSLIPTADSSFNRYPISFWFLVNSFGYLSILGPLLTCCSARKCTSFKISGQLIQQPNKLEVSVKGVHK